MSETAYKNVSVEDLRLFTEKAFLAIGCSDTDSKLATQVLLDSDLRGIDSHGVARLSGYIRLYEAGRINPKPNIRVVRDKKSIFNLDADAALGLVAAPRAMEMVIEKTETYGSSFCSIGNSNHFGIAAHHSMMPLSKGFLGLAMTNASPLVAPVGSSERMLGTNPISIAIPSGSESPFVLDMATSAAANGKLEIAERKGLEVPSGWLEDKNGQMSTQPKDLKEGGYLLPLGSDSLHGNHKGYGLGAVVDILSGVMSGANFGPWVPPFVAFLPVLDNLPGKGLGHFLGAMDIDGFMDKDEFYSKMDLWVKRFKSAKPTDPENPVLIHGEPEFRNHKERLVTGIPLIEKVVKDLIIVAEKYKLEHPFI